MHKNHHQILGVQPGASKEEIKQAYRRLAKLYHPDVNKSQDAKIRFQYIHEAYQHLTNPPPQATKSQTSYQSPTHQPKKKTKVYTAEERQRARQQQRQERERKEQEKRNESVLYNVFLLMEYLFFFVIALLCFALAIVPVLSDYAQGRSLTSALLIPVGGYLCYLLYKQIRRLDTPNYRLLLYGGEKNMADKVAGNCFFSLSGTKQSGKHPYRLTFSKIDKIRLHNSGIYNHSVQTKRIITKIYVPRSDEAYRAHIISKIIRHLSIVAVWILLSWDSWLWEAIVGALLGGMLSKIYLWFAKVKSDFKLIYNLATLFRVLLFLSAMFWVSEFGYPGIVRIYDFGVLFVMLIMFVADLFVLSVAEIFAPAEFKRTFVKLPPTGQALLDQDYELSSGGNAWLFVYPFVKWLF